MFLKPNFPAKDNQSLKVIFSLISQAEIFLCW